MEKTIKSIDLFYDFERMKFTCCMILYTDYSYKRFFEYMPQEAEDAIRNIPYVKRSCNAFKRFRSSIEGYDKDGNFGIYNGYVDHEEYYIFVKRSPSADRS